MKKATKKPLFTHEYGYVNDDFQAFKNTIIISCMVENIYCSPRSDIFSFFITPN